MEIILKELTVPARFRFSKPMNDEELLRFCAKNGDLRIEQEPNGDILVMALVGTETAAIEGEAFFQLRLWADTDRRGKALPAGAGFRLPDGSVRGPDAAWVSFARWNALPPQHRKGFASVCPEFVIEIRSDSDRLPPVQAKMQMWIVNGVEVGWLIDPRRKEVTIYRPGLDCEVLHDPSSVQGTGPVAGFELILD